MKDLAEKGKSNIIIQWILDLKYLFIKFQKIIAKLAEFIQFPAIGFSVKIVHGREGLYSLKDEWLEVTNSLRNKRFYHLYQWYKSYLESIGKEDNSIYFILLYKNKILQVIFPLRICKKRISKRI